MQRITARISFGVLVLLGVSVPSGALKAADIIFDAESVFTSTFGTLDATTGVFTQISTGDPAVAGLADIGGVLYGTDYESTGQLYSINQTTGSFTAIGSPTGGSYYDFGSTTSGLFVLEAGATLTLYSINATTGAATLVGDTGLCACGYGQLSNNNGTLYLIDDGNLYTLNTTTGLPTLVGPNSGYTALSFSGGILYGAASTTGTIDTINTATGASTTGPTITGAPAADSLFYGLAPLAATTTPEPATMIPLGLALAGLALVLRRRQMNA